MGDVITYKPTQGIWVLKLLLLSFLIPREFHFPIGDFQFSVTRIILLFAAFYIIKKALVSTKFKWLWIDSIAFITFIWPVFAYVINNGFFVAFESGGILFLETAVPYFLTRFVICHYQDLKGLSAHILLCITILVVLGIPESLTGSFFIHDFSGLITGAPYDYSISSRLGLWRAMGPTDHPIVFGTICSSGILIAYVLGKVQYQYLFALFFCLVGTFISLSSGPLLVAIFQILLLSWLRVLKGIQYRWIILGVLIFCAYIFVDIYSNRDPFRVMFSYLLFNTGTGYARYYMWINGLFLINQDFLSMMFGYGNSTEFFSLIENPFWEYTMRRTIDSFWLVQLLQFGWTLLVFYLIFLVLLFRYLWKKYRFSLVSKEKNLIKAWLITAISLTLIGFTVDFWGAAVSYYYIVLAAVVGVKVTKNSNNGSL